MPLSSRDALTEFHVRRPTEDDYARLMHALDTWWDLGGAPDGKGESARGWCPGSLCSTSPISASSSKTRAVLRAQPSARAVGSALHHVARQYALRRIS